MPYTQEVHDFFHADALQAQNAALSTELENLDAALTAQEAREQIRAICQQHLYASRRFLMRFLEERYCPEPAAGGGTVTVGGVTCHLLPASEENVMNLTDDSRWAYIQLLTELAQSNTPPPPHGVAGISKHEWRGLMRKGMQFYRPPRLLSREEACQIAHGLGFDARQAEGFLLRILNNDGFSPKRSEDLIERFCFLCPEANDVYTAQTLKARYQERTRTIPRRAAAEEAEHGTALLMDHLSARLTEWRSQGLSLEETQERFLTWLVEKAPILDLPGRSAHRIYQNLAVYVCRLTAGLQRVPADDAVEAEVEESCLGEALALPEDPEEVCARLCSAIAGSFDNRKKIPEAQTYRYITIRQDGTLMNQALGSRIPELLRGTEPVTKADLLFLLFFTLSYLWERPNSSREKPYYEHFCCFWNLAHELLEAARLPEFYAPNPLEYAMLLSIWSEQDDQEALFYPFELYESLCDSCQPQQRVQPSRAKTYQSNVAFDIDSEKERIEEAFAAGTLELWGVDRLLAPHLLADGGEGKQYIFSSDGIFFGTRQSTVLLFPYPETRTGALFAAPDESGNRDALQRERLRFVYGLSIVLAKEAKNRGINVRFRTNFKQKASLTILEWSYGTKKRETPAF